MSTVFTTFKNELFLEGKSDERVLRLYQSLQRVTPPRSVPKHHIPIYKIVNILHEFSRPYLVASNHIMNILQTYGDKNIELASEIVCQYLSFEEYMQFNIADLHTLTMLIQGHYKLHGGNPFHSNIAYNLWRSARLDQCTKPTDPQHYHMIGC